MKIDYAKLAEARPGERPYKGYLIPLEKGYVRIMASRLDAEGMVVAVNYYGKVDESGKMMELTRVTEKRQKPEDFEADLESFRKMLEGSGITMFIEEIKDA